LCFFQSEPVDLPRFEGLFIEAMEENLTCYIDLEVDAAKLFLQMYTTETQQMFSGQNVESVKIPFRSVTSLLQQIKKGLKNCTTISRGKTLLFLVQRYLVVISEFGEDMSTKMHLVIRALTDTKNPKSSEWTCAAIIYISRLYESAKFLEESLPNLELTVKKCILKALRNSVNLRAQGSFFSSLQEEIFSQLERVLPSRMHDAVEALISKWKKGGSKNAFKGLNEFADGPWLDTCVYIQKQFGNVKTTNILAKSMREMSENLIQGITQLKCNVKGGRALLEGFVVWQEKLEQTTHSILKQFSSKRRFTKGLNDAFKKVMAVCACISAENPQSFTMQFLQLTDDKVHVTIEELMEVRKFDQNTRMQCLRLYKERLNEFEEMRRKNPSSTTPATPGITEAFSPQTPKGFEKPGETVRMLDFSSSEEEEIDERKIEQMMLERQKTLNQQKEIRRASTASAEVREASAASNTSSSNVKEISKNPFGTDEPAPAKITKTTTSNPFAIEDSSTVSSTGNSATRSNSANPFSKPEIKFSSSTIRSESNASNNPFAEPSNPFKSEKPASNLFNKQVQEKSIRKPSNPFNAEIEEIKRNPFKSETKNPFASDAAEEKRTVNPIAVRTNPIQDENPFYTSKTETNAAESNPFTATQAPSTNPLDSPKKTISSVSQKKTSENSFQSVPETSNPFSTSNTNPFAAPPEPVSPKDSPKANEYLIQIANNPEATYATFTKRTEITITMPDAKVEPDESQMDIFALINQDKYKSPSGSEEISDGEPTYKNYQSYYEHEAPELIQVLGRSGFNSAMNGLYERGPVEYAGKVYYKKQGTKTNWHIRWYPQKKKWVFDWRGLQNDDVCAAIGSGDVPNPTMVRKVWKVYDKSLNKWLKDDQIKVRLVPRGLRPESPLLDHPTDHQKWEDVEESSPQVSEKLSPTPVKKETIVKEDESESEEDVDIIEAILAQETVRPGNTGRDSFIGQLLDGISDDEKPQEAIDTCAEKDEMLEEKSRDEHPASKENPFLSNQFTDRSETDYDPLDEEARAILAAIELSSDDDISADDLNVDDILKEVDMGMI